MELNVKHYFALLFVNFLGVSSQSKCDIRVWYLNIVTDDVFNGELTDSQDRLRTSIETLVLKSTSSAETAMVNCNILDIYNSMLKEQFNYMSAYDKHSEEEVVDDTKENVETSKTATETKLTDSNDAIANTVSQEKQSDLFSTSDGNNQTYVYSFKEWVLQTCSCEDKNRTNGKPNSTNKNSILNDESLVDTYEDEVVDTDGQESNSNIMNELEETLSKEDSHEKEVNRDDANDNLGTDTDIDETEFDEIYLDNVLQTEYEHLDSLDYSSEKNTQSPDSNDQLEIHDSGKAMDVLELPSEIQSTAEGDEDIYEETTIPKHDKLPTNSKDPSDKSTMRMCHDTHSNLIDVFFIPEPNRHSFTDLDGFVDQIVAYSDVIDGREIEENSSFDKMADVKSEKCENTQEQSNTVHFKDIEKRSIVEGMMEEQNKKVHALELTVTKLENKLLMDALKKQDYSSTITKLENHILRMENELLKMNKNYQNLRTEHEHMSNQQNKYLKLAQTDDRNKIPPEVALYSKKNSEIIAEHHAKIEELSRNLHRHMQTTEAMSKRFEFLEERNNMLHRMIMNQTLAISSVIQTIQHMSERSIRLQEQNNNHPKLGQDRVEKLDKIDSAASDVASGNIIGQLDNYVFNKQSTETNDKPITNDKPKSIKRQHFDKIHTKERSLEPWLHWCLKASPPQSFYKSFVLPHCIPFSNIFWLQCSESKAQESNNKDTSASAGHPKAPDGNDSTKHNQVSSSASRETPSDIQAPNSETIQTPVSNENERTDANDPNDVKETTIPDKLIEHQNIENANAIEKDFDNNNDSHKDQTFHESVETAGESIATTKELKDAPSDKVNSDDKQTPDQDIKTTKKPIEDEEQGKQVQNENVNNDNIENADNHVESKGNEDENNEEKITNESDKKDKSSDDTNSGQIGNNSDKPNDKIEAERETTNGLNEKKPTAKEEIDNSGQNEDKSIAKEEKDNSGQNEDKSTVKDVKNNSRESEKKPTAKEEKDKPNETKVAGGKNAARQLSRVRPKYIDEPRHKEARDCYDHYLMGHKNDGIFKIKPLGQNNVIDVFCDMRKGGWTVIQRRQDGTTNFFLEWKDFKKGFGGLYGEHWLGNDNIHYLTNQNYYSLRVDLMDWDKTKKLAVYDYFLVEDETVGYRLNIDGYSGDAGDGLTKHHLSKFSTKDVDNDKIEKQFDGSCAKRFHGAGWYYKCYSSNLNGKYYKGGKIPDKLFNGVTWKPWTGPNYSLKKVEMKIRPASVEK